MSLDEVGEAGKKQLIELRQWLLRGRAGQNLRATLRPSITTRSEAELFGVSIPRFAARVALDDAETFIVNARRLGLLASTIEPTLDRLGDAEASKAFLDCLGTSSCIGDAILAKPAWIGPDIHVITDDLLPVAYGDRRNKKTGRLKVTPYLKHMALGGGLCAQAVCFMATVLHRRRAPGIFGVTEITAVARGVNDETGTLPWVNLKGLLTDQIIEFFRNPAIDLNTIAQAAKYNLLLPANHSNLQFARAVQSYLLSDMPVIIPVDLFRLRGRGRRFGHRRCAVAEPFIIDSQGWPVPGQRDRAAVVEDARHAVLLVGCQRTPTRSHVDLRVVVHDPATAPYLVASLGQIANAGPYKQKVNDAAKDATLVGGLSMEPREMLEDTWMLPVTAGKVMLSLLEERDTQMWAGDESKTAAARDDTPRRPGLQQMYTAIKRVPELPRFNLEHVFTHLRLMQGAAAASGALADFLKEARLESCDSLVEVCRRRFASCPSHWWWIEFMPESDVGSNRVPSLWVWDAQLQPDRVDVTSDIARQSLAFVAYQEGAGWGIIEGKAPGSREDKTRRVVIRPVACGKDGLMKTSVISSFRTQGLVSSLTTDPRVEPQGWELYCFMQDDADNAAWSLSRYPDQKKGHSACARMASFHREGGDYGKLAREIVSSFSACRGEGRIVAFATFLPEISSQIESQRLQAVDAYRCLILLAKALRNEQRSTDDFVIEFVCGGRIQKLKYERFKGESERNARAEICSWDDGVARLIGSLNDIAPAPEDRVILAAELEPGPLFLLHDWESMHRLLDKIDKHEKLRQVVGLNLDVAHWMLAGIEATHVGSPATRPSGNGDSTPEHWTGCRLRDRIVHAHISDHGNGHFSDVLLHELHRKREFLDWLRLLQHRKMARANQGSVPFSGYVSVEFEAAKNNHDVVESLSRLSALLREVWQEGRDLAQGDR